MTFHETSNRNPSPIKPKGRNRLGITARLPRWAFAVLIALCGIGACSLATGFSQGFKTASSSQLEGKRHQHLPGLRLSEVSDKGFRLWLG